MKNYTKKVWITIPATMFKQLRKKGLLDHLDNIITDLIAERYNIVLNDGIDILDEV